MKRLFALLFTAVLAFSLAMPVFAQDSSASQEGAPKAETKVAKTKVAKTKKAKTKKEAKTKTEEAAPPQ
jgi:hypothetical protein